MKKLILPILLITIITFSAQCQKRRPYKKSNSINLIDDFGIFLGLGGSVFTKRVGPFADGQRDTWNNGFTLRLNTAAFIKKNLKSNLFAHFEIGYNQKGGGAMTPNGDVIINSNGTTEQGQDTKLYLLDYLEFPIMIGIRKDNDVVGMASTKHYFNFGIAPAFLTSQQFKDIDGSKEEIDIARNFNASILADYQLVGKAKIPYMIMIRLFYSPVGTFKEDSIDGYNFKTSTFGGTFGIGLMF